MTVVTFFKKIFQSINNSVREFPITLSITTLLTILLIVINHGEVIFEEETINILTRIALMLGLAVPISLCIKLSFIRIKKSLIFQIITYIIGLAFLIMYYFFLYTEMNLISGTRFAAISIIFVILFFTVLFLNKKENIEKHSMSTTLKLLLTYLFAMIFYLGLIAILATVNALFNLNLSDKLYLDIFIVSAGIFAPAYFLSNIETDINVYKKYEYPSAILVLFTYILMPLISIYTLILYAYFIKILIDFNWPSGTVSNLILWYSIIGAIILFFLKPINTLNSWIKTFVKWFPKATLPLIILLFISIGIRINQYGVSENRYLVVIMGIWCLGIMIYWSFAKDKKTILIPVSLVLVALISFFSPLNSFVIAKNSQNNRFEDILEKYDMLDADDKLKLTDEEISSDDKNEISAIIRYFSNRHNISDIKVLPKDFKINEMEKHFGFKYEYNMYAPLKERFFSYNINRKPYLFNIEEYDYLYNFTGRYPIDFDNLENEQLVFYDQENKLITIKQNGNVLYEKSINEVTSDIKLGKEDNIDEYSIEDMTVIEENKFVKLKYIFTFITGNSESEDVNENMIIADVEFILLVDIKTN